MDVSGNVLDTDEVVAPKDFKVIGIEFLEGFRMKLI